MKNKGYLLIPFVILFSSILNAQPYYYGSNYIPFKVGHHGIGSIYRVNMNNPFEVDTLLADIFDGGGAISDQYGNWIAYEENSELYITNAYNLVQKNMITNYCEDLRIFSFSYAINKLVAQFVDSFSVKMALIDPVSLTITDSIPRLIYEYFLIEDDVNFSRNGDRMYLIMGDSILLKPKIVSYSLLSKQILSTKFIDEISYSGYEKSYFNFRRNGMAVIESYYSMEDPYNYYKIYFLDKDSLSIDIKYLNPADGYISNNGKYLVMLQLKMGTDTSLSSPTGKIDIYDMINGELKKTIQLPPNGEVMCFENYPNNVYYTFDMDEPTRQVYALKMDSIFNVIDLTNLTPDTAFVESSSFILTVKGQGFDTLSVVYFNGQPKTTAFVSDNILIAEIPTADLISDGNYSVWVKDEWSVSNNLQFTIRGKN